MRAGFPDLVRVLLVSALGALPLGAGASDVAPDAALDVLSDNASLDASLDIEPDGGASDWQPFTHSETLIDGSTLSEYVVQARAFDRTAGRLRLSFSPRFECEPMVGLLLAEALETAGGIDGAPNVLIDGIRIDWPIRPGGADVMPTGEPGEPGVAGVGTAGWLYAGRQVRRTVRLRIDIGDRLVLQRADDAPLTFSLIGSRNGAAEAEAACRAHPPIPFELP